MTATDTVEAAPAFDIAAERIILGTLMLDSSLVNDVAVKLGSIDFYQPRHGTLFEHIVSAHESGVPTEPVALAGFLADQGLLGAYDGGVLFLHRCVAAVPTVAQAGYYVDRVLEMATRRRLQAAGIRITNAATSSGWTSEQAHTLAEELIQQIRPVRNTNGVMVQLGELVNDRLDAIEQRKDTPAGLPTGFIDLDKMLGGLRKKQLITVVAPTGGGKSLFLTDISRHLSIKKKYTVAHFSLEMACDELFERILSAESGVPYRFIRDGDLDERHWSRMSNVLGPMSTAPLFLCDQSEITVKQMEGYCRVLAAKHGLDAVIVDYNQLVRPSKRGNTEQEQISDVSQGLKNMAGNLDVPVIAASQANGNADTRTDKEPQLGDLRGSRAIANASNVVLGLYRPDYYDHESPRMGEADVFVLKARSATKGKVTVAAQLDKSRFVDMAIV